MIGRFGLASPNPHTWANIELSYEFAPRHFWQPENRSSELLLIAPAVWVAQLGWSHFDIRVMGIIHGALYCAAFFWWQRVHRSPWVAIAFLLMFTDASYVTYMNSFYTDAGALLFLLLTIVAAGARNLPAAALFAMLLVTAKPQHSLLALPLAAWLILQFPIKRSIAWAGALLAAALASYLAMPYQEKAEPLFTVIFSKVALGEPAALSEIGLDSTYAPQIGKFAYNPESPLQDPAWRAEFIRRTSHFKLISYYLRHPLRAIHFIHEDLRTHAPEIRSVSLGNYPSSAGKPPGTLSTAFGYWSAARSWLIRNFPFHIWIWFATALIFSIVRRQALLAATLAMALIELAGCTLADAAETSRHLFLFHALTDLSVLLCLKTLISGPVESDGISSPSR